ncbi:hypothetical protein Tco_0312510 [Tanacetum coccineum]
MFSLLVIDTLLTNEATTDQGSSPGGRENLNVKEQGEGRNPGGGLPRATEPVQMNPSPNFVKENLGTLRIMIKELDR